MGRDLPTVRSEPELFCVVMLRDRHPLHFVTQNKTHRKYTEIHHVLMGVCVCVCERINTLLMYSHADATPHKYRHGINRNRWEKDEQLV